MGKFKTIAIGISVYVAGMCMAAIGSMPEIFGSPVNEDGSRPDDYWQNNIQAIRGVALRPDSKIFRFRKKKISKIGCCNFSLQKNSKQFLIKFLLAKNGIF